jgi:hypothetical protein
VEPKAVLSAVIFSGMGMSQTVSLSIAVAILLCPILLIITSVLWLKTGRRLREVQQVADAHIAAERIASTGREAADRELQATIAQRDEIKERLQFLEERFAGPIDADREVERLSLVAKNIRHETENLQAAYSLKKEVYDKLSADAAVFGDRLSLAEMGIYEPHFEFSDSEEYKRSIIEVREHQKSMVTENKAVSCDTNWTVEGSLARGRTMSNRAIKLTLRAFNNECEAAIANTRWNNVNAMEKRITLSFENINKLNLSNNVVISTEYKRLKLKELFLVHEYREKLKIEREERAASLRLAREEQKLIRDIEKAQEDEERYAQLLEKAKVEASHIVGPQLDAFSDQIRTLENDLEAARKKLERAKALAEQTRSGYVYVISNIGSFGEGVVKIGLTRRLDPIDRVRELGDASVPFLFDTHAMIYSDDAPALERGLHGEFEAVRVNAQNSRKEFFRVTLEEVEEALKRLAPDAPFFRDIEAQEYHETLARRRIAMEEQASPRAFPEAI